MNASFLAYQYSPVWLQNLAISTYGLLWKHRRFGPHFRERLSEFQTRESFDTEQWRNWQTTELRKLLAWCFLEVPFYQKQWKAMGLGISELRSITLEDFSHFPILTKAQIQASPQDFISRSATRLHSYATSGSTGTPLMVKMSSATHQHWSAAYEVRCRRWAGVDFSMSRGMIGGRMVVPSADSGPPFWRYNAAESQIYFSAFHISQTNAKYYAAALRKYKPTYLVGYASAHYFLARFFEEQSLEVPSVKAVLTSSEKLLPEMRDTLRRVYQCPVFDAYSGVEPCCLASECECHRLHVSPDVGLVELGDSEGKPVMEGSDGQILATGFLNREQPMIRYRLGDLARFSKARCPCGRNMPVLEELVGRLEDTITGPNGQESVRFHGIFVGLTSVQEGQIIQEERDRFTVRVVTPRGLDTKDQTLILNRFKERLGNVRVEITPVPAIERTRNGKFRAVISRVQRFPSC